MECLSQGCMNHIIMHLLASEAAALLLEEYSAFGSLSPRRSDLYSSSAMAAA